MNYELEYIADCIFIEAIAKDPMIKNAEGILSSVFSSVKDYVMSLFDKDRPIASVLAFIGPGILFRLGFPWLAVIYEVADVLGFDWISFWDSVKSGIANIIKSIISSGSKPSEAELSSNINRTVATSASQHFDNEPDIGRLKKLINSGKLNSSLTTDISNANDLYHFASKYQTDKSIIKTAGLIGGFTSKLAKFFIKTISWLIKTALVSLGFAVAGGAVSSIFKTDKNKPSSASSANEDLTPISIRPSQSISQEMLTVHRNDLSNAWIERASIDDIDDILLSWVFDVYPQLSSQRSELEHSSSFNNTRNKFLSRNRLAAGLDIISIPKPYQRKIDIVAEIVRGFLAENHSSDE
jgi:hypothetical protein